MTTDAKAAILPLQSMPLLTIAQPICFGQQWVTAITRRWATTATCRLCGAGGKCTATGDLCVVIAPGNLDAHSAAAFPCSAGLGNGATDFSVDSRLAATH